MQIKSTMSDHFTTVRMAIVKFTVEIWDHLKYTGADVAQEMDSSGQCSDLAHNLLVCFVTLLNHIFNPHFF